jgi:hypothetical protein
MPLGVPAGADRQLQGSFPVLFLEGANFIIAIRWFGVGEKDRAEIADLDFVASG